MSHSRRTRRQADLEIAPTDAHLRAPAPRVHAGADCDGARCPFGAARSTVLGSLRMISVNHRTASLEALEAMTLDAQRRRELSQRLADRGIESATLMTCGRGELYWRSRSAGDDAVVEASLREIAGHPVATARRAAGLAVGRHLFRVAAGLESAVLGESEVLGQMREMIVGPKASLAAGPVLTALIEAALRCGGRARAETAIGAGSASVASLAAQWVLGRLGRPPESKVLIVGSGQTGMAVARHLRAEGVTRLVFLNRTSDHALEAARELACDWAPLDRLTDHLADSGGVVLSLAAPRPVLTREVLLAAGRVREREPLPVADLSMPRGAEPALREAAGVELRDLTEWQQAAGRHQESRLREVPLVEALIEQELSNFLQWIHRFGMRPLVLAMRDRAERICRTELARALAEQELDEPHLHVITHRIVDLIVGAHVAVLQGAQAAPRTEPQASEAKQAS